MNDNGATPKILIEARKLIGRPPPFSSEDFRLFIDAAEHIPRDEPVAYVDSRILRSADQLAPFYAERPPKPPTPFDDRISEAEKVEAEKQEAFEAAGEERWARAIDLGAFGDGSCVLRGRAGPVTFWTGRGGQGSGIPDRLLVDKASRAAQEAQEAYDTAHDVFKKARVARNELESARGRWRAVAHLKQ